MLPGLFLVVSVLAFCALSVPGRLRYQCIMCMFILGRISELEAGTSSSLRTTCDDNTLASQRFYRQTVLMQSVVTLADVTAMPSNRAMSMSVMVMSLTFAINFENHGQFRLLAVIVLTNLFSAWVQACVGAVTVRCHWMAFKTVPILVLMAVAFTRLTEHVVSAYPCTVNDTALPFQG
mgnify:CR=1 FL=1